MAVGSYFEWLDNSSSLSYHLYDGTSPRRTRQPSAGWRGLTHKTHNLTHNRKFPGGDNGVFSVGKHPGLERKGLKSAKNLLMRVTHNLRK